MRPFLFPNKRPTNELQFYTNSTSNSQLDGNGNLAITAREESLGGRAYTSARLKTEGKFTQQYGRIEARIKLPTGQGIWPAFWMLGDDFSEVGWPQTGEIDIMEARGQDPNVILGTIHGPGFSAENSISRRFRSSEAGFDEDFHVYSVDWDPARIAWSIDGRQFGSVQGPDVLGRGEWVFDHPFFLLLNLAVGGSFVGDVGQDTEFPQTMLVDYVRVFSRTN